MCARPGRGMYTEIDALQASSSSAHAGQRLPSPLVFEAEFGQRSPPVGQCTQRGIQIAAWCGMTLIITNPAGIP